MVSTVETPETEDAQVRLEIPLITTADEETFDGVVATSRALPVVIVMTARQALESKPVVATLEELARESDGKFQLVNIDVEASPAIAQAFQIEALPTVVALIGARPVPLFQGTATKDQIRPLLDQVREAGEQMGLTARVAVTPADTAAPTPEEHLPAIEAEARGDLTGAIAAWEKVVELNPRDEAAKTELARVRLLQRSEMAAGSDDPVELADACFGAGQHQEAFDLLLSALGAAQDDQARDAVRTRLLDLFRVAGNTPEVRAARKKLTTLLMI